MADLERYDDLPGSYVANLKVSRVGGVLRALRLVEAINERGWPLIVGAHVGETSVLTRAAMLVAAQADDLAAQEGAFGSRLIEREPVTPSLRWGRGGKLDLSRLVRGGDSRRSAGHAARRVAARLGNDRPRRRVRPGPSRRSQPSSPCPTATTSTTASGDPSRPRMSWSSCTAG